MPDPNYAAYLNSNEGRIVGPAISLHVHAGDEVQVKTFAKYEAASSYTNAAPFVGILSALASTCGMAKGIGSVAQATEVFADDFAAIGAYGGNDNTKPRAFLNYTLLDDELNYVDSKFIRIDGEGFEPNQPYS